MKIAIKTSIRRRRNMLRWGDYHFAKGLADALEQLGYQVRIDCLPEWERDPEFADIDLVLRGHDSYENYANRPHILWMIYPGKRVERDRFSVSEINSSDSVLFASEIDQLRVDKNEEFLTPSLALMQAFDQRTMYTPKSGERDRTVFVGNNHMPGNTMRPIVKMAHAAGLDPQIYGPGWADTPMAANLVASFLPNEQLGDVYRQAKVVLCDHFPSMREHGYVSNRIYDALACGAPVISDYVNGLPAELEPFVYRCKTTEDVQQAYEQICAETPAQTATRLEFAKSMVFRHSFEARAKQIECIMIDVLNRVER